MPLLDHCKNCYQGLDWKKQPCKYCSGTCKVATYRVVLSMGLAKKHGWTVFNSWPDYGTIGKCRVCNTCLQKRQRKFCSKKCKIAHGHRLYFSVHWQKRHVVVRDGPICKHCGTIFESPIIDDGPVYPIPQALELDHIVPIFKNGSEAPENLQLLCKECHKIKTRADLAL